MSNKLEATFHNGTYSAEDVTTLLRAKDEIEILEARIKDDKKMLALWYERYVLLCPHAEAVRFSHDIRGWGDWTVCKSCGLEDRAEIGGSPGDEYDYGYAGHADNDFWKNTTIYTVKEKEGKSYQKSHRWIVRGGKPFQGF